MTKIPKLILLIIALTAIFLWLSTAFNSCGNKADDVLNDATEAVGDFEDGIDDFDDDEDIFSTDGDDTFEDDTVEDVTEDDLTINEVEEETDFTEPDPQPVARTTAPVQAATRTNSSGNYMVIAGNYLVKSNAKSMVKKLSNLGYNSAEIAVFDRSQYHTVIAARYSDYGRALEVESAIKRKGVDCYVKKKQY